MNLLTKCLNADNTTKFTKNELIDILKEYKNFTALEHKLLTLVYKCHYCDSFEDIFRDFDSHIEDKILGIEMAIENITQNI